MKKKTLTTIILIVVLAMAAAEAQATALRGMGLLAAYALGMMLPFLACMGLWTRLSGAVGWLRRHQLPIRRTGGAVMILLGIMKMAGLF